MSAFRTVLENRIRAMLLEAEAAGVQKHNATTGHLREQYITNLLKNLTPPDVSLTSGTIIDAEGGVSPQLDLIAAINELAPNFTLHESISMVPVETAILAVEIKSKIDSKGLEQVADQNRRLSKLTPVCQGKISEDFIIPTFILSLDSINKDIIVEWMKKKRQHSCLLCN